MKKSLQMAVVPGALLLVVGMFLLAESKDPETPRFAGAGPAAGEDEADNLALAFQPKAGAPANAAKPTASGWLGLMLEEGKEGSVRVSEVFPGGPGAFGGVRVGDVVEKVGGKGVANAKAAAEAIEQLTPDQKSTLTVRRGGKSTELKVMVGNLREFHHHYAREMLRRDPRDPGFGKHHGISSSDMQVEVVRRLFEQNQRLETSLQEVLEELHALRAEVRKGK